QRNGTTATSWQILLVTANSNRVAQPGQSSQKRGARAECPLSREATSLFSSRVSPRIRSLLPPFFHTFHAQNPHPRAYTARPQPHINACVLRLKRGSK